MADDCIATITELRRQIEECREKLKRIPHIDHEAREDIKHTIGQLEYTVNDMLLDIFWDCLNDFNIRQKVAYDAQKKIFEDAKATWQAVHPGEQFIWKYHLTQSAVTQITALKDICASEKAGYVKMFDEQDNASKAAEAEHATEADKAAYSKFLDDNFQTWKAANAVKAEGVAVGAGAGA
jgi:hypothetical protein